MQERNYLIHPNYIILILVLFGVTALFMGFSAAYLYNRLQQGVAPVRLPSLFYYNSILLLASSYSLWSSKKAYQNDQTSKYQQMLVVTLVLTIVFLIAQILAWNQLYDLNISLQHSTMASYMYVITGLHFAHLIAGIPFLIYFIYVAVTKMKSPMTVLIYFADTDKKRKLDLLNIYWHFLDALWLYLVIFFLINYLIK
ncbi:MAG: cytochrome c oxidase subunit 3 [Saprospiraceae bacterium]|nr:cytochrome c oxidase subunit 3 [Saprospiraceae bacterium]MBP7642832.1 cytochrome c oxidase subunit 3 [Saprospiraceae bacterium]